MAEIQHPDGRVELAEEDLAALADSPLFNHDLQPIPVPERRWGTYNFAALWISMAHCIPTYMLAAGLIDSGMSWSQALFTIFLGNAIVLIPILLNSHPGTRYGIPFPVLARASFGVYGANIAAVIRGLIAVAWYGIQTYVASKALIIVVLIPLALKGVTYRPSGAATVLRRNLAVYGLGGLVVPF